MTGPESQPNEGPWYWVYLRPYWELFAAPARNQEESQDHPHFWRETVAPRLAEHYKISSRQLPALNETPYGLPRGRVSNTRIGGVTNWNLWHGNDLPKEIPIRSAFGMILDAFNLRPAMTAKTVRQCFDEHEQMLIEDAD